MSWEQKELLEIFKFIDYRGQSPDKKETGIPLLTAKNIKKGYISIEPKEYINIDTFHTWMVRGIPKEGDILFTTEAPLGNAALLPKYDTVSVAQRIICLSPKIPLDTKYYLWYILSEKFQEELNRNATGSTAKGIRSKELAKIKVPVPPLFIQQEIASILDAADELRQKDKALVAKYNELTQALFIDMFGNTIKNDKEWKRIKLGEFVKIKHGFAFKSEYFSDVGEYILLTPGNFHEEGGYKDRGNKQKYYSGLIDKEYILNKNDLIIAMTEQAPGLLGSAVLIPESNSFLHNQRLGRVIFNENHLNRVYLFYLFNNKLIRDLIHNEATGTKVQHTSPTKIESLEVNLPPIEFQNQFAERIELIEKQKKLAEESLKNSEALFNSLLDKAFKGELTSP